MANIDIDRLLSAAVVTGVMSRTKSPPAIVSNWLKMNLGGSNVKKVSGDIATWDIFDKSRTLATGRVRGSGPATITRQSVGSKSFRMHRSFLKFNLLDDEIFNKRALGSRQVDARGQDYVLKQEKYLAEQFINMREFMVTRMLRGGFDLLQSGQDLIPVEKNAGTFQITFDMPAGNLAQLDILGAGSIIGTSWDTIASATPITDMMDVSSAFEQKAGYPLKHIWMNSVRWMTLIKTTEVINLGGSVNTPFDYIQRDASQVNADGIPTDYYSARLRGAPQFDIHVCNAVLDVNGTVTQTFDDDDVLFAPDLPNIGSDVMEMYEGSEIVRENVMDQGSEKFGFNAWTTPTIDPAGRDLKALDISLPVPYKPNAWAFADVVP